MFLSSPNHAPLPPFCTQDIDVADFEQFETHVTRFVCDVLGRYQVGCDDARDDRFDRQRELTMLLLMRSDGKTATRCVLVIELCSVWLC